MHSLAQLLTNVPDFQLYANTDLNTADPNTADPNTIAVQQITFDSRAVVPGAFFVAVQGRQFDGHRYLADAVVRGAVAIMGTLPPSVLWPQGTPLPKIPYIQVKDSRLALALCSAALYDFPSRSMAVIGVTGTDGKTTTASLLEAILTVATQEAALLAPLLAGRVGVITTVGARIRGQESDTGLHVTTPESPEIQHFLAQMRTAACQYAIVESTSHGLDQARVAAVDFDIAVVTNITHEHLDYHGTRDAYVAAKAKLFRSLYASPAKLGIPRCAVLNADDGGSLGALQAVLAEEAAQHNSVVPLRAYGIKNVTPGSAPPLDVAASEIVYLADRTAYKVTWWGGEFQVETRLIGDFNVYNVLAAITAALALAIAPATIQRGVAAFHGVLGRMERIDQGQAFLALVDFAHTPVSLERALLTLRPLVGHDQTNDSGRLIAIFGSAGLRDRAKRRLMGQVSGRLADFTVITAEDPRTEDLNEINAEIAAGVREFAPENAFVVIPDRTQAIQFAVDIAKQGDVVAAFGKGHERSMCFGTTEYPWSDQQVMHDALQKRLAQGWQDDKINFILSSCHPVIPA